ncbi:MAG: transglycosylase family protein [Acidimicrobiales bacterium]
MALAAPVVAAEPAGAPARSVEAAAPAKPVHKSASLGGRRAKPTADEVRRLKFALWVQHANRQKWIQAMQAKHKADLAKLAKAQAEAKAKAAAAYPKGACGGDLPPCWVMMRESRGDITARNPRSSASGKWQFLRSTWAGYGGYAEAWMAPEPVQDAKARLLWNHGRGCGHWSAC